MNAEMQKVVKVENKDHRRFVYFGRMEKLAINKKNEEYVQWIHQGVVCVGYDITKEGNLRLGVSFCSPEDSFSKKKAHLIIGERINAGVCEVLTENFSSDKAVVDMSYEELVGEIEYYISDCISVDLLENYKDNDLPRIAGVRAPRWFM